MRIILREVLVPFSTLEILPVGVAAAAAAARRLVALGRFAKHLFCVVSPPSLL